MNLDKTLRELRKKNGLTQNELAEYLNVSRQAISQWENGKSYPDIENLVFISKLYGISMDEFLGMNSQNDNIEEKNTEEETLHKKNQVVLEKLALAVILVLGSQFSILGIIATIAVAVWMRNTKRNYKIIYLLCLICFLISVYNTYLMLNYLFFDYTIVEINPV